MYLRLVACIVCMYVCMYALCMYVCTYVYKLYIYIYMCSDACVYMLVLPPYLMY